MKIIQKDKEKLIFSAEIDESLANAIRRSVNEIPVLAIDEVEIYKNDSVLYDEIIANRLGLIPLKNEKLNLRSECSCKGEGCGKCTVELKLSEKGPKTVFSSSIKGKAEVVFDEIPITLLRDDQELELVATAAMGKGRDHAKFSPALVYYRNLAEIDIKNCDGCKRCAEVCPLGLISVDKKAEVKDIWKCDLCGACSEACDCIKVKPGKEILFFIESWGQMDAKDVLIQAVNALKENLKEAGKA